MEIPHLSAGRAHSAQTLPSIRIQDSNSLPDRRHLPLRTSSHPFGALSTPMPIPNSREYVPPPLPPPRHIHNTDIAWEWGNSQNEGFGKSGSSGNSSLGSVRKGSSLFRGPSPSSTSPSDESRRPSLQRLGGSDSTLKQPESESLRESFLQNDDIRGKLPGIRLANPRLSGEESLRNAVRMSAEQSYDKTLLQKIEGRSNPAMGHPNTPPRSLQTGFASEVSPTSKDSSEHLNNPRAMHALPVPENASGPLISPSDHSARRWGSLPDSAVSPRNLPLGQSPSSLMEFRNPRREGSGSVPSFVSDPEHFAGVRHRRIRRSESGSLLGSYDETSSVASRSNRGSYDQGIFIEGDPDFPSEENNAMRHLNLGDRSSPRFEGFSPTCKIGQKRRASSPPQERDDRFALSTVNSTSDLYQRRTSGHLTANRLSPVHRSVHGSVSSTSSMPRNGSYASSAGLSVGASSMTSMSSYDRLSPGGVSPSSEHDLGQESPYPSSLSLDPSPRTSISRAPNHRVSTDLKSSASSGRKLSNDGSTVSRQHGLPKFGGLICECCPKKPKKFENIEDLRLHENEKQYTCSYCHNRFKNKNEMERHQNSLHLRRHSWSCATLSSYQAAFHPSTHSRSGPSSSSPNAQQQQHQQTNSSQQTDVCGYCGEAFSCPPNWEARYEHLNTIHKYNECNQSKKFFRADHFRQHLKHSHAGTSGKWTNQLENACMKDEPLPEPIGSASGRGSISEVMGAIGGTPGTAGPNSGTGGDFTSVRGSVISEEHDES
ncbi:MAG: hypothetical protein M4579_004794 [Chaenotheca gracillima]|nr:MAG: hypothetical protein M4579_004794 [Chaenotheca gracillima]